MVMEIIISVTLLFVGIAALVTIHMCIVRRAFSRSLGSNDDQEGVLQRDTNVPVFRGIGMTPQDLKKLSYFEYSKQVASDHHNGTSCPTTECAVCLDIFKIGDKCRVLPNCHHVFHAHCVDVWLVKTPFCPVCRTSARVVVSPVIYSDFGQGSHASGNGDVDGFL